MACEKHNKDYVNNCYSCLKPLCPECASISRENRTYCFQCAMNLSLKVEAERRELQTQAEEQKEEKAEKRKRLTKKILLYIGLGIILLEVGIIMAGRFLGHNHPGSLSQIDTVKQKQEYDFLACMANLGGLNSAVKLYKKEHSGASPPSLTFLIAQYFKVEPLCPSTGKTYIFSSNNDGYKISCPNPAAHAKKNLFVESSMGLKVEDLPGGVR